MKYITVAPNNERLNSGKKTYLREVASHLDLPTLDLSSLSGNVNREDLEKLNISKASPGDVIVHQFPFYDFDETYGVEPKSNSEYFELAFVKYAQELGYKVVGFYHDFELIRRADRKDDFVNKIFKEITYLFDHNIVPDGMVDEVINDYKLENVTGMPYHFPSLGNELLDPLYKERETKTKIGYFGTLAKFKNAFDKIPRSKEIEFVFIGDEGQFPEKYPNLNFLGKVDLNTGRSILKSMDYGLIWDDSDEKAENYFSLINHPAKLSDYLASGLPVIARKNSHVGRIIEEYGIGFTVSELSELDLTIVCSDRNKMVDNVIEYRKLGIEIFRNRILNNLNLIE